MSIWSHFRTVPCTSVGYDDAGADLDRERHPGSAGGVDVSTARHHGTAGLLRLWLDIEPSDDEVQLTPARARDLAQALIDAADYCDPDHAARDAAPSEAERPRAVRG